ncbi:MAG: family 10 glycosylhydrolase [Clostridia bacterium]|nr:family 10 glycosylhydrolase [Clostridia bacterium]
MKKLSEGMRGIILLLAMIFLFSSCKGEITSLTQKEVPSRLPLEAISDPTMGLLNPDAEVRGVWIATVGNINFPSRQGLSTADLKGELEDIVKNCTSLGLNTIFFQVRPAADALYNSELFPASEYVSGTQGKKPGGNFDCLDYLISIAHEAKINVHAWVNPLRVTYGSAKYPKTELSYLAEDHIARKNPDWVIPYADGKLYFDAGIPEVREYIADGVREIAENYAVDGIVFDDYFYPYPVSGAEFEDSETFSKYGTGEKDDWRRENINALVKGCYDAVKAVNSECLFGISPFGIWQNDDGKNGGSDTAGLEAYESLYCDALAWARGGYVDYIAPQLYWRFSTAAAPYGALSDWWNAALDGTGVKLLICHAAYMYDEWESPEGELTKQIGYSREAICYRGSVLYGYEAIAKDSSEIRSEISDVFSSDIIYSDYYSTSEELTLHGIPEETDSAKVILTGSSDPTVTLAYEGKKISRERDGSFEITVSLSIGENEIAFDYGGKTVAFKISRTE